ncbi:MAG TPA: DUF1634 domain-containing protein [Gemmataceae bacterium]|nr:DUF1634 domain-containing protein [Gemmataceae bacterium]
MAELSNQKPPEDRPPNWNDERIDRVIGNLLRIGVIASAVVVFTGGVLFLAREGRQSNPDFHTFRAESEALRSPGAILRETGAWNSRALIMLGLLLLIATPVARVMFSIFAFALQRDYLYVLFTVIVLAVLLYSLFSGYLSDNGML